MTPETTDDQSVLGSLPDTRPTRFGRERGEKPKATAAAKPKAVAKPKATAQVTKSRAPRARAPCAPGTRA